MNLIDFDGMPVSYRVYGGSAGRKNGIQYDGKNYLIKFPGSTSEMQNVAISYTNSPLSEYIGSHIYEILGIPVHKTLLGFRNGKIVVACEDFLSDTDHLYEFAQLKVTFTPHFVDSNGEITNGTGTDLKEILLTLGQHEMLKDITGIEERFWNMFVVDALIGNPDRNNGNWGIILHADKSFSIAPVYDNGNSFNNKWDDEKMVRVMSDHDMLKNEASEGKTCVFTMKKKRINPYHLISGMEYEGCNEAVKRLVPKMISEFDVMVQCMDEIPESFKNLTVMTKVQKDFFVLLIKKRLEDVFKPVYEELKNK